MSRIFACPFCHSPIEVGALPASFKIVCPKCAKDFALPPPSPYDKSPDIPDSPLPVMKHNPPFRTRANMPTELARQRHWSKWIMLIATASAILFGFIWSIDKYQSVWSRATPSDFGPSILIFNNEAVGVKYVQTEAIWAAVLAIFVVLTVWAIVMAILFVIWFASRPD
jgi:magnesium-transporting ATPase (P-type)